MSLNTLTIYSETENINTCFSPNGNCTEKIVFEINNAKSNIFIQAYSFTSNPIAQALVNAKNRNVQVIAILDHDQLTAKSSVLSYLISNKVSTYLDTKHTIAHNKIIIIDDSVLITGSFNFTMAAEFKNSENILIIKNNSKVIKSYTSNFMLHKNHSEVCKDEN